jgi:hypothetical protein
MARRLGEVLGLKMRDATAAEIERRLVEYESSIEAPAVA